MILFFYFFRLEEGDFNYSDIQNPLYQPGTIGAVDEQPQNHLTPSSQSDSVVSKVSTESDLEKKVGERLEKEISKSFALLSLDRRSSKDKNQSIWLPQTLLM